MELPNARLQKKLIGPCIICGVEGNKGKFRRFTEDAYKKALQHGTLDSTWVLNVTQFCNSHYMTYIVNGTNTEKSVKTPESAISLKRRWKDDNIERGTIGDQIDCDNSQRDLVKYQTNAIIVNIDDYHNIHGLRIPTTTSTSAVAHMTTVLAIPIPTATAIPKYVGDNVYASIHNPRIVDNNVLINKIEDRFMALLSQSFNDRFAKHSESDLLDNLTVHCYDIDIHEKRHNRQLNNTLLIDFVELNLHSTEAYIKAMETFASFPEFHEYLQRNVIPLVADWPGQILPRKVITMQQQQSQNIQTGKIPECVSSFIPIMGPLHVSLNSRETVMMLFYDFFNLAYKSIFGKNKRLANKPRPWRINLLLQLMSM